MIYDATLYLSVLFEYLFSSHAMHSTINHSACVNEHPLLIQQRVTQSQPFSVANGAWSHRVKLTLRVSYSDDYARVNTRCTDLAGTRDSKVILHQVDEACFILFPQGTLINTLNITTSCFTHRASPSLPFVVRHSLSARVFVCLCVNLTR